ncbi:MAG: beta-lactamase family protein, partial [Lentisphaeria bacterium]|nr:beta-lactamase family protein [Lentisphaeria bacterium]
ACAMIILSSCCTQDSCRTTPDLLVDNAGTSFARDAMQPSVDSGDINGYICIFFKDGLQELTCGGYADMETKRPITLDDPFMMCSQTKSFSGLSVAMLIEEGKLGLDDPVAKYLPEFENLWIRESFKDGVQTLVKAKNTLTVRMCLNHTGGFPFELPNYKLMGGCARRMPLRSVAATAAAMPLVCEPGTKFGYSNLGIDVGAAIVEVITGMRWEEFLQKRVFDPLGMTETTFWPTEKQLANRIKVYKVSKDQPISLLEFDGLLMLQQPFGDDRVFPAAGAGLWTTARDQYKFYKMLMNRGVGDNGVRSIKEETIKSLLAVSSLPKGIEGGYSLGFDAPAEDSEDAIFGHGGAWTTNAYVNWHKRYLRILVLQLTGDKCLDYFKMARNAANEFLQAAENADDGSAFTGRTE